MCAARQAGKRMELKFAYPKLISLPFRVWVPVCFSCLWELLCSIRWPGSSDMIIQVCQPGTSLWDRVQVKRWGNWALAIAGIMCRKSVAAIVLAGDVLNMPWTAIREGLKDLHNSATVNADLKLFRVFLFLSLLRPQRVILQIMYHQNHTC